MNLEFLGGRRWRWGLALGIPAFLFLLPFFVFPSLHVGGLRTLPRDSNWFHYRAFHFVAQTLRETGRFPDWYPAQGGGSWIEPLANNTLLLAPYRLLGYLLAVLFPAWSTVALHKFVFLVVGRLFFLGGCALVLRDVVRARGWPLWLFGAALSWLAVSPLTVAILHQEQGLGTVLLVPWVFWFWRHRADHWVAGILAGVALNLHYPQILMIYGLILFLAKAAESGGKPPSWLALLERKRALLVAAGGLLLGVLPLAYSYLTYAGSLQSHFREQSGADGLSLGSYASYLKMCLMQEASLQPPTLLDYLGIRVSRIRPALLDDRVLAVGPLAWVALVGGLALLPRARMRFHFVAVGLLVLAGVGIHGPLPRVLWGWFPGLGFFRQWFHFTHLLTLQLAWMAFEVLGEASRRFPRPASAFGVATVVLTLPFAFKTLAQTANATGAFGHLPESRFTSMTEMGWRASYRDLPAGLVEPRFVDARNLIALSRTAPLLWKDGETLRPASPGEISVELGAAGDAHLTAKRAGTLWTVRPDDSGWRSTGSGGRKFTTTVGTVGFEFDAPNGGEVWIARSRQPWKWLVLASMAYVGLIVGWLWRRRAST